LTTALSETQKKKEYGRQQIEEESKEMCLKKILVPIDGSSYSMRAIKFAIEVAKLQNAQILCVHVISKLPHGYGYAVPAIAGPIIEQYFENIKNQSQSWFNQIIKMAEDSGINNVKTDILVNVLSITDAIINYATDNSVDLIVIGTKGNTDIDRFLVGSIANNVVKHAHCPVIVVR
jgi:nucleotide-binding universal stress UspA family protein